MQKTAFTDDEKQLIKRYLLGGAALGGSAALATSLISYMRHLNKDKNEQDDDTLYVYRAKDPVKQASLANGLAIAGGGLSAIGMYALVRKLYSTLRARQAQNELDKAQHMFIESQGYKKTDKKPVNKPTDNNEGEISKTAGAEGGPLGLWDWIAGAPVALPILLALGSGAAAYHLLGKSMPQEKKKVKGPRKIEIVDGPPEYDENGNLVKPASVTDADGLELMIRLLGIQKSASSDAANLVAAVASGEAPALKNTVDTIGFLNALDTVKGASAREVDPIAEHVAVSYLAKSARLSPSVGMVVAAEFAERYPSFYKAACSMDEDTQESLRGILNLFGADARAQRSAELGFKLDETELSKSASYTAPSDAALELFIKRAAERQRTDEAMEATDSTEDSTETSREASGQKAKAPKVKILRNGKSARKDLGIDADIIDKILNPPEKEEPVEKPTSGFESLLGAF